jgi:hypothetical protein
MKALVVIAFLLSNHSEPAKQGKYHRARESRAEENPRHLADGGLRGCASLWLDEDAAIALTLGTKKLASEHAAVAAVTGHGVGIIPKID